MGQLVDIAANGRTIKGYLAAPAEQGPGLIVLQEWWGLVDHIKDVCDRFAAEGFVALAPDLYEGQTTKSPDEAGKLMMALNIARTASHLKGAVDLLVKHEQLKGQRVGIVGFCMGGQLALYAASKDERIGASVDYYGIHPEVKPDYAAIKGPVMGFFGAEDEMVTPDKVRALEAKLREANVPVAFTSFDKAGHAFFNDTRPEAYNAQAARTAWQRSLTFFRENLG